MFQAWLAAADALGNDAELRRGFAAMRMASSGAAPLPEDVWAAMRDRAAVTVWEGYGLTEAAPVVASTLVTGRPKPNCIGGPLPGLELELRDTATTEPIAGALHVEDLDPEDHLEGPGEIWLRGPNLFAGYWPDGADGPDADGWLGTGDLAYRDADGDLHLVDRRSDLILVSGFNVYPAEVERVLDAHPAVAESAVIGVPDARTGAAVRAVVVLRPGERLTFEDLQAHAAESLARYKVPTSVHFLPSLPHSLTGKVSRARLRELGLTGDGTGEDMAEEGGWSPVADSPSRLQLLTRAGCHLCETAAETLARIGAEAGLAPQAVDVDGDPELRAEYGDRVPVVLLDGREHSYFTVDVVRLRRDLGLA
jgi:long-chain acyl-CoA synthetase